ncbi:hypothetical protein [Cellulomonas wangsupingiae]|uniref:hypothetical protein n=1 Tax=Cellulomonas wangsupingiae TaxID=2968085 RepID=UPI001D0E403A|nr:hypothetical protein [Cellulomonas wangsupingiae]MCM0640042.1 hypothetical protein [Cellulomonas wangsupingiae]
MVTTSSTVAEAVARLAAACRLAGIEPPEPAQDVDDAIARVRAEIAPLRLPPEIEEFWRLVDPGTLRVAPWPEPSGLAFALDGWRMHRDEPGMCPRILFPLCYASHSFVLVELDDGGGGGHLFRWGYGGEPFRRQHASIVDLLDLTAHFVEQCRYERREHDGRSWIHFDPEHLWGAAAEERLAQRPPHPRITTPQIEESPDAWPPHWRRADGLPDGPAALRGATATVAQLLAAAAAGEGVSGTLPAHAATAMMGPGGRRLRVTDHTGTLDVWAPSGVGAHVRTRDVEIDVVVTPGPPAALDTTDARRDLEGRARAGDLAGVQAAAEAAYAAFTAPAQAVATDIRAAG